MAVYGYIIVDSCVISFNFNCIMQLKEIYNIATVTEKNATTFGDLPDCLGSFYCCLAFISLFIHCLSFDNYFSSKMN